VLQQIVLERKAALDANKQKLKEATALVESIKGKVESYEPAASTIQSNNAQQSSLNMEVDTLRKQLHGALEKLDKFYAASILM